ncbi:MAG: orotidine-5'-phosphate decarboxylase [Syntrophomonadaceae bacterium]|nr:orotidine-5'-phosphate decarboxylase [Syntrophomonadaceae bacterium]
MQAKDRIILALDVDTEKEALALVETLYDRVGAFKVGMQLFNSVGPGIVQKINQLGGRVFVDLKFHDIPNTAAAAGRVMTRLDAFMYNVHIAGGREMMTAVVKNTAEEASRLGVNPPAVLGVTVLTSISSTQLREEMKVDKRVEELVVEWAVMAQECGLSGVVASPQETALIREACGPDFLIVTPGIRPGWAAAGDQKRITTPREALDQGADYMVIGRPIRQAADPREAAARIIEELEE